MANKHIFLVFQRRDHGLRIVGQVHDAIAVGRGVGIAELDDRYVDLLRGTIDVAIRIGRLADSSLVARKLAACPMVAWASPAYLARHGTPQSPQDLEQHRRLAYSQSESPGDWTFTDAGGRQHVVGGPAALAANNVQFLATAALQGAGIVYGPAFVFGDQLRSGALVPLLPDFATGGLGIYALYPSTRYLPAKVRRLIDQLAQEFSAMPAWDA